MKKLLLFSLFIATSIAHLSGQDAKFELGLRATSFQSFGSILKIKNDRGSFQRFRLVNGNSRFNLANNSNSLGINLSFAYGIEKRKALNDRAFFFHGFEPFTSFSANFNQESNARVRLGLGYVLGLQYKLTDEFSLAIESIPSLSGDFQIIGVSNNSIDLGFNSNAIALSFLYRFNAKS